MSTARAERRQASAPAPAALFAALGDSTRLHLVERLTHSGEALSIAALTEGSRMSRQAITKHLLVLQKAGVVHSSRLGRESVFSFAPEAIAPARDYLAQVSAHWDNALDRLKAFVET